MVQRTHITTPRGAQQQWAVVAGRHLAIQSTLTNSRTKLSDMHFWSQRQHCPKIIKPPPSLPLQMAERLLRVQPGSLANHVTHRSISDRRALTWLATETGWALEVYVPPFAVVSLPVATCPDVGRISIKYVDYWYLAIALTPPARLIPPSELNNEGVWWGGDKHCSASMW